MQYALFTNKLNKPMLLFTTSVPSATISEAVFNVVAGDIPSITDTIDSFISKKPKFDAVFFSHRHYQTLNKGMEYIRNTLNDYLIDVTPADLVARTQAYIDIIDTKFSNIYATYDIYRFQCFKHWMF